MKYFGCHATYLLINFKQNLINIHKENEHKKILEIYDNISREILSKSIFRYLYELMEALIVLKVKFEVKNMEIYNVSIHIIY